MVTRAFVVLALSLGIAAAAPPALERSSRPHHDQTTAHELIVSPNGVIELTNPGHVDDLRRARLVRHAGAHRARPRGAVLDERARRAAIADPRKGPHEIWVRKTPKP